MKITIESVLNVHLKNYFCIFGDVYLNGILKAWIGFIGKVELEAEPGENTIEILFKDMTAGSKKIKFYATKDVHIFVRFETDGIGFKLRAYTLVVGDDLRIIEESEKYK